MTDLFPAHQYKEKLKVARFKNKSATPNFGNRRETDV